jgi:hypothetical protein
VRRILIGVGTVVMGYAVAGALTDDDVAPVGVAVFLAAVLVLHDGVLMPLVLAAGALLRRAAPPLRVAAVVSLALLVVGLPLALGFGRPADNPSALPLPYPRNLLLILVSVWLVAGAFAVRNHRRAARRRRSG